MFALSELSTCSIHTRDGDLPESIREARRVRQAAIEACQQRHLVLPRLPEELKGEILLQPIKTDDLFTEILNRICQLDFFLMMTDVKDFYETFPFLGKSKYALHCMLGRTIDLWEFQQIVPFLGGSGFLLKQFNTHFKRYQNGDFEWSREFLARDPVKHAERVCWVYTVKEDPRPLCAFATML